MCKAGANPGLQGSEAAFQPVNADADSHAASRSGKISGPNDAKGTEASVQELRQRALRGHFSEGDLARWAAPRHSLVVFVSSTFTDTQHEREVLNNELLPKLREQAQSHGLEVVFVDMRWGITDDATVDHQVRRVRGHRPAVF